MVRCGTLTGATSMKPERNRQFPGSRVTGLASMLGADIIPLMKLGFIVEGDSHKAILERLVPKLISASSPIRCAFIRLGGRGALSTAYTSAIVLLGKKYDHVFIIFDTYTGYPDAVAEQEERVAAGVRQFGLDEDVTVCPAVLQLESWLLAGLPDQDAKMFDPKSSLSAMLGKAYSGVDDGPGLADRIDIQLAEQRSLSFAKFAHAVRSAVMTEATAVH